MKFAMWMESFPTEIDLNSERFCEYSPLKNFIIHFDSKIQLILLNFRNSSTVFHFPWELS